MISIRYTKNGLPILLDSFSSVETVAVSFSVKTGSREEEKFENGISHFLEHMMFKGTKTRTSFEIASEVDYIGASMNAYTSKENTVYYIKALKKDLRLCLDIISDMIQNSIFDTKDIDVERSVILQELASSLDDHDDVAGDMFAQQIFGETAIGRTILGTKESINAVNQEMLKNYLKRRYSVKNSLLSISGNIDLDEAESLANEYFNLIEAQEILPNEKANFHSSVNDYVNKNVEQAKFFLSFPIHKPVNLNSISLVNITSNILGGTMSSRLFQEIREKRGLAYTISSFTEIFRNEMLLTVYAGASQNKIEELSQSIFNEMLKMVNSVQQKEIDQVVNQYIMSLANMLENPIARSRKAASDFHRYQRYIEIDEIINVIKSIQVADVQNLMHELLKQKEKSIFVYGNEKINKNSEAFNCYFNS